MRTKIIWPWEITDNLEGTVVVADVWGGTTNIATLLKNKPKKLLLVNRKNVESAKDEYPNAFVIGESTDLPKKFFNISNYPSDVANAKIKDNIVLYMSNNGTKVIELAFSKGGKKIVPVSFTNIQVVTDYLKRLDEQIYLIPAGDLGRRVDEDFYCVVSLEKMIKGESVNLEEMQEKSKSFIREFYSGEIFDEESNFAVVFAENSSSLMAICTQSKGFIEIKRYNL